MWCVLPTFGEENSLNLCIPTPFSPTRDRPFTPSTCNPFQCCIQSLLESESANRRELKILSRQHGTYLGPGLAELCISVAMWRQRNSYQIDRWTHGLSQRLYLLHTHDVDRQPILHQDKATVSGKLRSTLRAHSAYTEAAAETKDQCNQGVSNPTCRWRIWRL